MTARIVGVWAGDGEPLAEAGRIQVRYHFVDLIDRMEGGTGSIQLGGCVATPYLRDQRQGIPAHEPVRRCGPGSFAAALTSALTSP
jgi:hypothetical protein